MTPNRDLLLSLSGLLDKEGKPIEAGWLKVRSRMPAGAAQKEVAEARLIFMCGALHLFNCICDADDGNTDQEQFDDRMCKLRDELDDFVRGALFQLAPTRGNA